MENVGSSVALKRYKHLMCMDKSPLNEITEPPGKN
jgi:hypothetical protein